MSDNKSLCDTCLYRNSCEQEETGENMTLEDAIKHAKEVAENVRYNANTFTERDLLDENCRKAKAECLECAKEHEQLASWLEELAEYQKLFESPKEAEEVLNMLSV